MAHLILDLFRYIHIYWSVMDFIHSLHVGHLRVMASISLIAALLLVSHHELVE